MAENEINRMKVTSDIVIEPNILKQIETDLDKAQVECKLAQQILEDILKDIHKQIESLSSTRQDHVSGIISSILSIVITALEYATIPIHLLIKTIKMLFGANTGIHSIIIIGHATGFYWTHEEILKLEEQLQILSVLEIEAKNSFEIIK